ncbi:MAG: DUF4431 domain-containing protein [Gemmatimonadales bacterium]
MNRRVVVSGTLSRAISGPHFTDVVMNVRTVSLAN